eukprot:m51a1_g10464 hypothetical protein (438) ;mRNA; f:42021-43909
MNKVARIAVLLLLYTTALGSALAVTALSIALSISYTTTSKGTTVALLLLLLLSAAAHCAPAFLASQILAGAIPSGSDPCSEAPFKSYRPSRFHYGSDSGTLGCASAVVDTVVRCLVGIATLGLGTATLVLSLFKRSRWTYVLALVLLAGGAVGFGYLTIRDGTKVTSSRSWCSGGMAGVHWTGAKPASIECAYAQPILVVFFDVLAALAWVAAGVWTIVHCVKSQGEYEHKRHHVTDALLGDDDAGMYRSMHDFSSDRLTAGGAGDDDSERQATPGDSWATPSGHVAAAPPEASKRGARGGSKASRAARNSRALREGELDFEAAAAKRSAAGAEEPEATPAAPDPFSAAPAQQQQQQHKPAVSRVAAPKPASGEVDFSSYAEQRQQPAKQRAPSPPPAAAERPPVAAAPAAAAAAAAAPGKGEIDFSSVRPQQSSLF